jgi:hypothetical protein
MHYELVVIGSGPGGLTAAVAAGKRGLRTALIERHGLVGGNMQIGLNIHGFEDMNGKRIIGGCAWELIQRCIQKGGSVGPVRLINAHMYSTTPVDLAVLQASALEMLDEAGVDVWLHTLASEPKRAGERITEIAAWGKDGEIRFSAATVIDATGDAEIAYRAGAKTVTGRERDGYMQPMSLVMSMAPVDIKALVEAVGEGYGRAVKPGCSEEDYIWFALNFQRWKREVADIGIELGREATFWGNSIRPGIVNLNVVKVLDKSGTDTLELSQAEAHARKAAVKFAAFLRNSVPGFAEAYITRVAPFIGVRETRRIVGRSVLAGRDCIEGKLPRDTVALGGYPVDIHDPADGIAEFTALKTGRYGIPYGTMLTGDIDNLLVSGRAISATHEAAGATRVMGTCLAIGEACGVAAALAAEQGIAVSDLDGKALRRELESSGAMIS